MVAESGPGGRHTQTWCDSRSEGPRICRTVTVPRRPAGFTLSELASLVTPDGITISRQKTPMTARPAVEGSRRRAVRPSRPIASDTARARRFSGPAVAPEVALELAGDGVAARLGQVHRVLGLLERPDVIGHFGILLREFVHSALPGARLLGQIGQRQRRVQDVLDAAQQRQGG